MESVGVRLELLEIFIQDLVGLDLALSSPPQPSHSNGCRLDSNLVQPRLQSWTGLDWTNWTGVDIQLGVHWRNSNGHQLTLVGIPGTIAYYILDIE